MGENDLPAQRVPSWLDIPLPSPVSALCPLKPGTGFPWENPTWRLSSAKNKPEVGVGEPGQVRAWGRVLRGAGCAEEGPGAYLTESETQL